MGLGQYFLDHQCVDINHAVLNQVQRQHADLMSFARITRHLTTACKEYKISYTIPLFGYIQFFVNFPT
ncbi:hypothetical protein XBJ1_0167 [Xenorhabdus bovienii SS-2004]|uniref:Uncharacterized protein n=1 Tax=Xenorhabdus bovienii (strain SS-2004) TaxID=406818 RepID=D3UYE0_XENBS|nr:hypothetical protein XBJ1_0167 [Xenorhabdus bovienii SS-2004]